MRILILGGTGFVGSHLSHFFLDKGHEVVVTSQNSLQMSDPKHEVWDGQSEISLTPLLLEADLVINLIGANIAAKRWTSKRKDIILESRTFSCKALHKSLHTLHKMDEHYPKTILQASACGFYGLWDNMETAPMCTETTPQGQGFLANVCAAWEREMQAISELGIRLCTLRFAPILGKQFSKVNTKKAQLGGFLAPMVRPFRFFAGGVLGSGKQPMPFVHIHDVLAGINFLAEKSTAQGIFNFCSPKQENMQDFIHTLARKMRRPAFFPVPSAMLKLVLGEMGEELILSGQKVYPKQLLELGFHFNYAELDTALEQCLV